MSQNLKYVTLDVFTGSRYSGNPLAIVHIPSSLILSQEQKQTIAREFNFSETVFLHETAATNSGEISIKIDIFTTTEELPFAGHPTIGTGWYILSCLSNSFQTAPKRLILQTLAGEIPVFYDAERKTVRLEVPHDVKVHKPLLRDDLNIGQPALGTEDYCTPFVPIVSIVKGMTFVLQELTSSTALSKLKSIPQSPTLPRDYLGPWSGFVGVYSYTVLATDKQTNTTRLQTRMFDRTLEDPATGSAASTLATYLATTDHKNKREVKNFEIVQGIEMGRRSEITVRVTLGDESGLVEKVELEGTAVRVMHGELEI